MSRVEGRVLEGFKAVWCWWEGLCLLKLRCSSWYPTAPFADILVVSEVFSVDSMWLGDKTGVKSTLYSLYSTL